MEKEVTKSNFNTVLASVPTFKKGDKLRLSGLCEHRGDGLWGAAGGGCEVTVTMAAMSEIHKVPRDGGGGGQGRENIQEGHLLVHMGPQWPFESLSRARASRCPPRSAQCLPAGARCALCKGGRGHNGLHCQPRPRRLSGTRPSSPSDSCPRRGWPPSDLRLHPGVPSITSMGEAYMGLRESTTRGPFRN